MENKRLQFKTNINCSGCVSKVKPALDTVAGIAGWDVDIAGSDKILTVQSKGITKEEVVAIIQAKGFKAEPL